MKVKLLKKMSRYIIKELFSLHHDKQHQTSTKLELRSNNSIRIINLPNYL